MRDEKCGLLQSKNIQSAENPIFRTYKNILHFTVEFSVCKQLMKMLLQGGNRFDIYIFEQNSKSMKSDESYLGFEVQKIGGSRKDTVLQVVELKQIYRNAFR